MKIVIISGRVVKDARTITTVEKPFTSFSVVVNEKTKDGVIATFFDVITNGTGLAQYLTKGKAVEVMGNLRLKEYTDDSGKTRATLTISAQSINFSPQEKQTDNPIADAQPTPEEPKSLYPPKQQSMFPPETTKDDLPF